MQTESVKTYAYSGDELDPIIQYQKKMKINLKNDKKSEKTNYDDIINQILEETDDMPELPKKEKKEELATITSVNNKDFDSFIEKSKNVLKNLKTFNETVKRSELNIEILAEKKNLQNRLNELTLNKEFRTEERERLKAKLSDLTNLENLLQEGSKHPEQLNNTTGNAPNSTNMSKNSKDFHIEVHNEDDNKPRNSEGKVLERKESSSHHNELETPNNLVERESKISISSFFDHKKGTGINQMFDYDNNKPTERKSTNLGMMGIEEGKIVNGKKVKNSRVLYDTSFKKYEGLTFHKKPPVLLSLVDQQYQCYSCNRAIRKSFFFFWNTARYCHYSGYWHCVDCISIEKKPIPYKALEDFDLRSFSVSLESQKEMDLLYKKPILLFDYNNPIVRKNKGLYDFLVLKRKIHLMYDMICNVYMVQDLMQEKINLVLKENLFSLENMLDIYNGSLTTLLIKCITLLSRHIDQCSECQEKGVFCKLCKDSKKIFVFDLLNTSMCPNCKHLYHTSCLSQKVCIHCVHDS